MHVKHFVLLTVVRRIKLQQVIDLQTILGARVGRVCAQCRSLTHSKCFKQGKPLALAVKGLPKVK